MHSFLLNKSSYLEPCESVESIIGFKVHEEAAYFAQQTGAFEVIDSGEPDHKMVMRQMVQEMPIYWCSAEKLNLTANIIGSVKW